MNTLLSQRSRETENNTSQAKAPSGKRLTSTTGLHVIDDEFILMKMQESEEKKNKKTQSQLPKRLNATLKSISTTKVIRERQGRPSKKKTANNELTYSNDAEVDVSILSLQSVIDMADNVLGSDDTDPTFD
ncbi:unnamed protein product [Rotaria magnacalcarata]|uniref:Uncharacterized protein n=1 Tax=Rotaria magnacalcarata TaxID=392030 RepID=A0A816R651_9BILA|nr:unnamed protein product [Rotaria magnacalcarata]CAF2067324.1 unnamed protein product [Rotaria magnacalcarata]CAF2153639.1 unnamed protein product [Rotaria magnacalcarata]CAF4387862.1 unnamed protein product [Rotaria magnacalcarata]CAF5139483.1 unnamed protein product [Rotaria magnacalcarata]